MGASEAAELLEDEPVSKLKIVQEMGELAGRRMGKFPSYAELIDLILELKELLPQSADGNAIMHALTADLPLLFLALSGQCPGRTWPTLS